MPKHLSRGVAIAAAAAVLAAGGSALAQSKHTLKVALFSPKPSTASIWFEKTRKEVEEKSKGRLELQMFYGSSMGPMPRHYDLARKGVEVMGG